MNRRIGSALLRWVLVVVVGCGVARAQDAGAPPANVEDALRQMSDTAGVVFTGEVTAVRARAGENGASGVVDIDFRVEDAVRGCTAGGTYTLREWAGLWSGGVERYRVGQRRLMLLHAPGAAGVSSPVGGMDGAIPIRGTAQAPGVASAATVTTAEIADLRWVGALLFRNGQIEETGIAAGVLGHPANGVAWLANRLAAQGEHLASGEVVLAGSFTRPVEVIRGDTFHADYGAYGSISCQFI